MFQAGDLVVYGTTGVCRVESIDQPNKTGPDRHRKYYQLKPLYQDGVIYTPVENTKVSIRPVISREQAEHLIDLIPSMQAEAYRAPHFAGAGAALPDRGPKPQLSGSDRTDDVHLRQAETGGIPKTPPGHGG